MRKLAYKCGIGLGCMLAITFCHQAAAQITTTAPPGADSTKIIHLLNADTLTGIQPTGKDSSQFQKLTGNVRLMQGQTIFTCDSALQNLTLNTIDAYGHIHINQADTINTYADFLHYEANSKVATLTKNVRMTDGQMVLTTNLLDYDMNTHVGSYLQGGKLVTGSTVLVSQRGYYFADTKDVYFKNSVELTDPEYTLATDTLLYNTNTRIATFVAPTTINTGGTIIHTTCGYYNTLENFAHLCNRSTVIDSSQWLTADSLEFNRNTGIGIAVGNVVWTDTANHMTMLANHAISDQGQNTILATQKPLLILERSSDTLFMAADTFFSGPLVSPTEAKDTSASKSISGPPVTAGVPDSASLTPLIPSSDSLKLADTANALPRIPGNDSLPPGTDSLRVGTDSLTAPASAPDTISKAPASENILPPPDTQKAEAPLRVNRAHRDSVPPLTNTDSVAVDSFPEAPAPGTVLTPHDTILAGITDVAGVAVQDPIPSRDSAMLGRPETETDSTAAGRGARNTDRNSLARSPVAATQDTAGTKTDTTQLRYVIAFHHVRIFSDSLQGVADSLYYSDLDSAFHLYTDPALWTGNSQLTGDTIVLTTRDQQADRILLQQHAMIINQSGPNLYNQIKGNNITGYFSDDNQLDWMQVDGNAESLYYAQDDHGAYVGANKSTSAMIRMYFKDGSLNKVVLLKDVDGEFLPPTKVPEEDQKLRGFKWMEDRRPKSKADLMR